MKKCRIILLIACIGLIALQGCSNKTQERSTQLYAVHENDSLYLDVYDDVSVKADRKPCMIFLFGGGFVTGSRDDERYLPYFDYMTSQGWKVVSIDYRLGLKEAQALVGQAESSDKVDTVRIHFALTHAIKIGMEDLYAATSYVIEHAENLNIDPQRVVVAGSSAGAVIALHGEYGICNRVPLTYLLPEDFNYAGVISMAGALYIPRGGPVWLRKPAPIQFFHGDADRNVPYRTAGTRFAQFYGSAYLAEQLTDIQAPHYFYSVENEDHVLAVQPMYRNREEIDIFLQRLVEKREPLIIDTQVTQIGKAPVEKNFGIMEYVMANFGAQ